jgi:PAS domain S-box-containing protein
MFKRIRRRATAYVVLVISFLFTLAVAQYMSRRATEQAHVNFEQIADAQRTKIAERLENRITLLRSATGLFATTNHVTAEEFRAYVARLELGRSYPEMRAIGYSARARRGDTEAYPIAYLEPGNGRNEQDFGLDLSADAELRPVLEHSRDSATPVISGKWNHHHDEPLFVICLPVYRQGLSPETLESRRAALDGFLFGFVHPDTLIQNSVDADRTNEIGLRVFSGSEVSPARLLESTEPSPNTESRFTTQKTIDIPAGKWTLVFTARPGFPSASSQALFVLMVTIGGFVSILLFLLTRSEAIAHIKAEDRAEQLRKLQEAQQRLNAQLEQHRTKLNELISQVPGVVWEGWANPDGTLLMDFISDYAERLLGYSVGDWTKTPEFWLSVVHPEDRERLALEIQDICEAGTGTCNFRWLANDGRLLWVEMHAAVMGGNHNGVVGLRGVIMDVTARRRAEETLRHKDARLQIALSAARMATWHWDLVTGKLTCDDTSSTWADFVKRVHLDDQHDIRDALNHALREEKNLDLEFRLAQQRDNEYTWVALKAKVFQGEDGRPAYITGVLVDVADRKRSAEALRASEERYRLAARATNDAIWDWDLATDIVQWNEGLRTLFGYVPEQCGRHISWRHDQIHPDDKQRVVSGIDAVINGGGRFWSDEYRFRCANGLYANVTDRAYIEQNESGCATRVIAAMTDVTRLKQAEREREQLLRLEQTARKNAESANRMKDVFLATVSHELRTPITPILGWVDMLRKRTPDQQFLLRGLGIIDRNARAQARLIEDLLDVSRIITGKLHLKIQTAQIQPIVQAAIDSLQPAADSKGVRLEASCETPSVESAVDPDRLQQVVWNLLSNAIKFTSAGGIVRVTSQLRQGELSIVVTDNGEGIDLEFLPHVFERFSQADTTSMRTHGGLGVGLAIVRHIVDLHGGHVNVHSEGKGHGASFTVTLPARMADKPATSRKSRRNEDKATSLKDVRVLVVEDEADTREFLATVLRDEGAAVTTAGSVREALATLQTDLPGIVISDIAMPDENGYALLEKLRKMEQTNGWTRRPAIALTAYAREEDRKLVLDAGFEMHISKPFEPPKLIAAILEVATKRMGKAS